MKEPTVKEKIDVLLEDLNAAARIACELKQNNLAAILYWQIAALALAMSGQEHVDPALRFMEEMALACQKVAAKYEGF